MIAARVSPEGLSPPRFLLVMGQKLGRKKNESKAHFFLKNFIDQ